MALGNSGGHAVAVVRVICGERRDRCRHLVEQGANLGTVIDLSCGQRCQDNLTGIDVNADVQLLRGPPRIVLRSKPFMAR